jgi:hypothetical protein
MIEVFKTSVTSKRQAEILVVALQKIFPEYTANFDLDGCDRILRVASRGGTVLAEDVIYFLKGFDFHAEVLADDVTGVSELDMMLRCITQN